MSMMFISYTMMFIVDMRETRVMAEPKDYHALVKNILKAELKRKGVSYRDLAERLGAIGVHESERNIANKISRGGFSAAFFVQCLDVIGCNTIRTN